MWQLRAETARPLGLRIDGEVDERRDPVRASETAAQLLANLMAEFGDRAPLLPLVSYYVGPDETRRLLHLTAKSPDGWHGARRTFWHLIRARKLRADAATYVAKIVAVEIVDHNPDFLGGRSRP